MPDKQLRDQNRIRELIDEALQNDRVEVFYQPFFNVAESRFNVCEALVRIRTEDGEIVPPGRFIPVAEEGGQIIPLGIRVFEKVCAFIARGETRHVLTGMIDILRKLNMNIVAEGIETEEQMKVISELGVEFIQGFYFSRPIPEDEFLDFLKANNR